MISYSCRWTKIWQRQTFAMRCEGLRQIRLSSTTSVNIKTEHKSKRRRKETEKGRGGGGLIYGPLSRSDGIKTLVFILCLL